MSKITGKDLIKLGFKKCKNIPTSAMDSEYHYYTYDVGEKKSLLISGSNDEKVNGGYYVEFYDVEGFTFHKLGQLKKLVKLLKQVSNG
jgi:hypothetical protein